MSDFQNALHDFVQASNDYRTAVAGSGSLAHESTAADALANAGDRLEAVQRGMMQDAVRDYLSSMKHLPADLYSLLNEG